MPTPFTRYDRLRFVVVCVLLSGAPALGSTDYYKRVIFDNSKTPDAYFYSEAKASLPSSLSAAGGHLPVETGRVHTPPNALRLAWNSKPGGGWEVEVRLYEWRNREINFQGDTLTFWCYSPDRIEPAQLPAMALTDAEKGFTDPLKLSLLRREIPKGEWVKLAIPLRQFQTASIRPFQQNKLTRILFKQDASDAVAHTLMVDDIRIEPGITTMEIFMPPTITDVRAHGYERHVDVSWKPIDTPRLSHYVIYRAADGQHFQPVGIQVPGIHRFADYLSKSSQKVSYQVTAVTWKWEESSPSATAEAATHAMSDDELLNMVEESCFRYYWEGAHPPSGMIRENLPGDDDIVATGATGFGIMALVAGAERGFVPREAVVERLLTMTNFLSKADRFHGVWPHFTNGATGKRMPVFGLYENGADLVETAFLVQGLLTARQYFHREHESEKKLYHSITKLWESIEWDWFRRTPDGDALFWHWSPEYTWHINHRLTGYNETMITYLLAIASPTHGVPASLYYTGWAGQSPAAIAYRQSWGRTAPGDHYVNGQTFEGIKLDVGVGEGGPLFFAQYSYMGFDPHFRDRYTNYFQNGRSQALINRAYCIRNPQHFAGYGPQCWGITAVDGPEGYGAFEPKAQEDKGVIAPTGAIGSFPYTPAASMEALKYFYRNLGDRLWGEFGFHDAFDLQRNWFSGIYMGLNQAPMVVMIENHRSGIVWKSFMANPEIQAMVKAVGFKLEPASR